MPKVLVPPGHTSTLVLLANRNWAIHEITALLILPPVLATLPEAKKRVAVTVAARHLLSLTVLVKLPIASKRAAITVTVVLILTLSVVIATQPGAKKRVAVIVAALHLLTLSVLFKTPTA